MFGFIAALHVIGWGLFVHYNSIPLIHNTRGSNNKLVYAGAGALAYTFGLRHAFDADHISAVPARHDPARPATTPVAVRYLAWHV